MDAGTITIIVVAIYAVGLILILVDLIRADEQKRDAISEEPSKFMIIIEAKDMTKNQNKEGTDAKTEV